MRRDETKAVAEVASKETLGSRRRAIGAMATAVSAAGMGATMPPANAEAQAAATFRLPMPGPVQAPQAELVSVLQYEDQARLALGPAKIAPLVGSDRTITDRITLRPRINISTLDMDLTCPLFGDAHFAPIIVGPMAAQKRFHPEGEVATARGASAAKAGLIVSSESSVALAAIAQAATTPLWLQVYAASPKVKDRLAEAAEAKARAVVVTVNAGASATAPAAPAAAIDWAAIDAVVKSTSLPVVVKGITRPQDAKEAVAHGAKGVVVSNYHGGGNAAQPGTLLLVAPVVEAVNGKVPVLVDGSFRFGSDILKALGFGAKAVLIGRPAMWGVAAVGGV